MDEFNTTLRISGFVLSSLMFHHLNSDMDVEGFILGECVGEENCRITDSQIDQIQLEHTMNVQKHVPCQKLYSFYSVTGDVSKEKIKHLLSNYRKDNVIGWYKQRRNTKQKMTFMEQVVHRNMRKTLSNQELTFMLLTPSQGTTSGSTHRLEFSAFIWHRSQYINVPILVSNLGNLEQQDYWRVSGTCLSLGQSQAVKEHGIKFFCSGEDLNEVRNINDMNDALLSEMQNVCAEVEKSERTVEQLQEEIAQLKESIARQKADSNKSESSKSSLEEPSENILLCSALRTLFPSAPSLRTQTLTVQGFPVLQLCCDTDHNIDISTKLPVILERPRRRKLTAPKLRRRCLLTAIPQRHKRKRKTDEVNDSASESGSDVEFEMNGKRGSNSPVY